MSSSSTAVGCLQVVLGVSAHVAAAGCLPSTGVLLVLTPVLLAIVLLLRSAGTGLPRWSSLLAGQSAVHVVLSVAATCAAASAGHEANALAAAPAGALVMTALHLVAMAVSVCAADHVEAGLVVLRRARGWLRALWSAPATTHEVRPEQPEPVTPHRDRLVHWLLALVPVPARAPPRGPLLAWS